MNSHDAEPGLYNNDLHVTGPRHLGLRCEGRKGPEERLDYFTVLPSPCFLVTLWLKLTQGQKVCVCLPSQEAVTAIFPLTAPLPTPPRLLDGQDLLLSVRQIFVTQVIGNRPSYWIRFPNLQYAGSTNQSQITWAG